MSSEHPPSPLRPAGPRWPRWPRAFHGEAIGRYERLIEEIATAEARRWPVGEVIELRPRMQAIALEAILRAVVGVRDERRLERLRRLLPALLGTNLLTMWALWAKPRLAGTPLVRLTALRHRAAVDRLLYEEIEEHRADPDGREDVLAALIAARDFDGRALGDEELRDQIVTLLLAGHETTATALAWCFERLLRHPASLRRLREELDDDAHSTAYLDAVISETLRVRPVLDAVWRKLAAPAQLAGYELPAGATAMPSIALVQTGAAYPDPDDFRPERMLERQPPAYTLVPFGGGARRCIGASFALMEMRTILRVVLATRTLRPDRPQPERTRIRNITLTPARGARAIISAD